MARQIFVNLPIKNMERSQAFFRALGFDFNPQFTNEQGACMVIADGSSYAMLLVEPFFQSFTKKPISDASKATEVIVCLSCDSRAEVDSLVKKALAAGATAPNAPQVVERAPLGGGHQPGARLVRDALRGPVLQRGDQRILRQLLGHPEVAHHAGDRGDDAGRLDAPDRRDRLVGGRVHLSAAAPRSGPSTSAPRRGRRGPRSRGRT